MEQIGQPLAAAVSLTPHRPREIGRDRQRLLLPLSPDDFNLVIVDGPLQRHVVIVSIHAVLLLVRRDMGLCRLTNYQQATATLVGNSLREGRSKIVAGEEDIRG